MNKGEFDLLDRIVDVTYVNLYTISKDTNIIRLSKVNIKNDKHWALLNITSQVCTLLERTAYLDMPFFDYWKMQRRLKNKKLKWHKNNGITCDQFINHIEDANAEILSNPFIDIANKYFPRKVKHENLHRRRDK